jgi:hypothetical protein
VSLRVAGKVSFRWAAVRGKHWSCARQVREKDLRKEHRMSQRRALMLAQASAVNKGTLGRSQGGMKWKNRQNRGIEEGIEHPRTQCSHLSEQ